MYTTYYVSTITEFVLYNGHFFLTNFASKIEMHIFHGTFCFHDVVCITQKIQSQKTPNFMKQGEINQEKSLSSFIHHFSPHPSVTSVLVIIHSI